MSADQPDEKDEYTSEFEKALDDIHGFLNERKIAVSRMRLRRILTAYASHEALPPEGGAREMHVLLTSRIVTPAELMNCSSA